MLTDLWLIPADYDVNVSLCDNRITGGYIYDYERHYTFVDDSGDPLSIIIAERTSAKKLHEEVALCAEIHAG